MLILPWARLGGCVVIYVESATGVDRNQILVGRFNVSALHRYLPVHRRFTIAELPESTSGQPINLCPPVVALASRSLGRGSVHRFIRHQQTEPLPPEWGPVFDVGEGRYVNERVLRYHSFINPANRGLYLFRYFNVRPGPVVPPTVGTRAHDR
jgi:hypothetical protein